MGLLCDLFVTTRDDALLYETCLRQDEEARRRKYSPLEFKRLTSLEFGTLWAILEGKSWDPARHMLIDVAFGDDNQSWLHEFQAEYVLLLSTRQSNDVKRIAAMWAATEEINGTPDDVIPIIEALVSLARKAMSEKRGLYMWGSL
jgi:hypothetical protein